MAIEVFNRYEYKYVIDEKTFYTVLSVMDEYMVPDSHSPDHHVYPIANIYYDTLDSYLIRTSLARPPYKEKLRLRAYGVPEADGKVFLEIKKKFKGMVNKRRSALYLKEAYEFLKTGKAPEHKDYMNGQVIKELEYFINFYGVEPKLYLAYDRVAYFEEGSELRISFDTNIRARRYDLGLEMGDYGRHLIDGKHYVMEIKTARAMPLWLVNMMSELSIRRCHFSKYGREYKETFSSESRYSVLKEREENNYGLLI